MPLRPTDAKEERDGSADDAKLPRQSSIPGALLRRQSSISGGAAVNVSSNAVKKDDAEKEEKLPKPPRLLLWGGVVK